MNPVKWIPTTLLFLLVVSLNANVIGSTSQAFNASFYGVISYPETFSGWEKTITWSDEAKETIQITDKGKILLNGTETKPFGFCFFGWLTMTDSAIENALDWMDAQGIRFVDIYFHIRYDQTARASFYFPKFYNHKKFVRLITFMGEFYDPFDSSIIATWKTNFDALIDHIDDNNWEDMIYAVQPTHELDWYASYLGKTLQQMSDALNDYDTHARTKLSTSDIGSVPTIHANDGLGESADPYIKAIIEKSDIAVRDAYPGNAEYLTDILIPRYEGLMAEVGKDTSSGYKIWWELGRFIADGQGTYVTVEMFTALLDEPSTGDCFLFYVYENWDGSPSLPTWYFDSDGNAEPWTENLASYFP